MSQRLMGLDASVIIVSGGTLEDELADVVQSFQIEPIIEIKSADFLGDKTSRFDNVFKGSRFTMKLLIQSQRWITFQNKLIAKARRITPDVEFNIVTALQLPNGESPTITLPDVTFGSPAIDASKRDDYVSCTLTGNCSEYKGVTS